MGAMVRPIFGAIVMVGRAEGPGRGFGLVAGVW